MSVNGAGRTASSTDPVTSSVNGAMATTSTQRNKKKFKKIDHYVLMQTLGAGTFAKVKLGMDERTKDYYAVKVIDKAHVRKNFMSDHVQKEIDSMRRLEHPNIVRLLKVFSTSKKVFLVMEFVNSGELYTEVVNRGRLIEPYARFYFKQLIEGLQHCHDHKVFHRDLKLDNLLLEKDGTLKIADFGLSTFLSAPDGEEGLLLSRDMMLYTQVGTPAYVAPEIIMCDAEGYIGAKVDAWASGIVLYALCAGCLPFDGETENDTFKLILRCDIDFPHFFSNDLIDLISNLLKTDPKDRYSLADVKAHPWCQGPVVTSQEDYVEEGDPGNAEEWEPTQASLKGFGSACRFSTARSDGIDSLDLGMRAESAETLLSGFSQAPTGSASKGASSTHRSTDMVPEPPSFDNDEFSPTSRRNFSREAWHHSVADKMQTLSQSEQQVSETEPGIGGSLYAAHLRSCLGEDSLESNATHSSEEDHESEIEDAQECAISKGFYGKHRKSYDNDGTSTDARKWMRRSLSALDVPWTNSRVGKYPSRTGQKNVAMKAHQRSNVRQKFRRELWENVSESLSGTQFKQLNERVEGLTRSILNEKSAFGKQRTADPGVHKTMTNLTHECIGPDNLANLSFGGMSEPTTPTSPGIVRNRRFDRGTLSEGKSKEVNVGAFVKSASFDGLCQNKSPRRRPRAVARSQVLQMEGDHLSASNELGTDNLSSPAAPATDSVMKKRRERLTKKDRSLANTSTVRFAEPLNRHDKNTKGSSHRERSVNTHWVKSVKDKQSWCKLMRDFEMIPDQEEFGKDSATLSVMWMKSLEAEDLAGPSVDSRFGPSEFALPRSYLEQPTLVRRSQVRQWRGQEARTALPMAESKGSPVLVKLDSSSAGTCIHADGNSDVLTVFKLNQGDRDSISMDLPDSSPEHHGDDRNYYNALKLSGNGPGNVSLTESVSPQLPPLVNTSRDQASSMLPDENCAIVDASNVDVAIDTSLGTTGIIDGPHLLSLLPAAEPAFRSSPKPHKVAFVEDSVLEQYMDPVPSTPPRRYSAQAWDSNGTNGKLPNLVQSQLGLSADNSTMSKTSTQIISDSGSKPGIPAKLDAFPHEAGLVMGQEKVVLVESNVSRSTTSVEQAAVHRVFDVEIGRPEQRIRLPDSTPFHYVWKPMKPFVQTASEVICSLSPFVRWENETEFRTLARPPRCHEKILEVLRTLGCTVMRNKQRDLKQKFTVYASRAVEESKIVITIRISQLDKILTSVSVKRKSGDKAQFKKLYSDLLRLYDRFVKIRDSSSVTDSDEGRYYKEIER